MSLIERVKQHPIIATITVIGPVASAIVAVDNLLHLQWFNGALSKFTAWLASGVTVPIWSLLLALILFALAVAYIVHLRSELVSVKAEHEALKNPTAITLDSFEERVLFWATKIYDSRSTGEGPTPADIADIADMTLTDVEAALDVLKQKGVVVKKKFKNEPIALTAAGRDYLRQQEARRRFVVFSLNAGGVVAGRAG